jgi:hypothetical protein
MTNLSTSDCARLRQLSEAIPLSAALASALADTQIANGLWRFFSKHYPTGGVAKWNEGAIWKEAWSLHTNQIYAFGEDILGNQLIVQPGEANTFLWNHENGEIVDLLLDPVTLIETVAESGLGWIDFYNNGSLQIAERKLPDTPLECHQHWTTPLILGGQINEMNISIVERAMHLIGHAKLWKQLQGCDPGTSVIVNNKRRER